MYMSTYLVAFIVGPLEATMAKLDLEDDAVLSQGVKAINRRVPKGQVAFAGAAGDLTFKPNPPDLIGEYFRD